jgi:hypothetical protein
MANPTSLKASPAFTYIFVFFVVITTIFSLVTTTMSVLAYNDNPNYVPYGMQTIRASNLVFMYVTIGITAFTLLLAFIFGAFGGQTNATECAAFIASIPAAVVQQTTG